LKNIKLFYLYTARVLGTLYVEFPISVVTKAECVISRDHDEMHHGEPIEYVVFEETLRWLNKTGYIFYEHEKEKMFFGLTLTEKGLALMNVIPTSIETTSSYGDNIVKMLDKGNKKQVRKLVASILSDGAKIFPNCLEES